MGLGGTIIQDGVKRPRPPTREPVPSPPRHPATGNDRRRWPRTTLETVVVLTELDRFGAPIATWSCKTRDIGRGGLGLCSKRLVHAHRNVLITIGTGPGRGQRILSGVVRHSRYNQVQGYILGVEFAPVPSPVSVQAGPDPMAEATPIG
jgi:PilZ domain-containing protein